MGRGGCVWGWVDVNGYEMLSLEKSRVDAGISSFQKGNLNLVMNQTERKIYVWTYRFTEIVPGDDFYEFGVDLKDLLPAVIP